jgi:hypothetical protein
MTTKSCLILLLLACLVPRCAAGTVTITNYVIAGEYKYATLDNAASGATSPCTSTLIEPSDNWEIAPNDADTRAALAATAFRGFAANFDCLALADGNSIHAVSALGDDSNQACGSNVITQVGAEYHIADCSTATVIVVRQHLNQNCCDLDTKPTPSSPEYESVVCCADMTWLIKPNGAVCNFCDGSCGGGAIDRGGYGTSCEADPEGHGNCAGGSCTCEYGFTGAECDVAPGTAAPTNTLTSNGRTYGTLANAAVLTATASQTSWMRLPASWSIAGDMADVRGTTEVQGWDYPMWGGDRMVFADGSSYTSDSSGVTQAAASGDLHSEFNFYMPAQGQIMLVQDGFGAPVENQYTGEVTNFFKVGNAYYATIENDALYGFSTYAGAWIKPPTGWTIAPGDATTEAAFESHSTSSVPWVVGSVALDGSSLGPDYASGGCCALSSVSLHTLGEYYRSSSWEPIIITKTMVPEAEGCTAVFPSNVMEYNGYTFATLDSADPHSSVAGCQAAEYQIPDGWAIADNSAMNRAARASLPFAATCIVFSDGTGYDIDLNTCNDANMLGITVSGSCAIPEYAGAACCDPSAEPTVNPTYESSRCCTDGSWVIQPNAAMCDVCSCGSTDHGSYGGSVCDGSPVSCSADARILIRKTKSDFLDGLLFNGDFEDVSGSTVAAWAPHGGFGYTVDTSVSRSGSASIKTTITDVYNGGTSYENGGAYQSITTFPDNAYQLGFKVTCYSKADSVSSPYSSAQYYSIYADIYYTDGSTTYYTYAPFNDGTHDWESAELDILPLKPVSEVRLYTLFKGHTGTVWFDDCSVSGSEGDYLHDNFADARWSHVGETDYSTPGELNLKSVCAPPPPPPPPPPSTTSSSSSSSSSSSTSSPPPPPSSGGVERRLLSHGETSTEYNSAATYTNYFQATEISDYTKLVVSVESMVSEINVACGYAPNPDNFALNVDIQFHDGSFLYGQTLQQAGGVRGWQLTEAVFPVSRAIFWVRVTLVAKSMIADVTFRNPSMQLVVTDEAAITAAGDVAPALAYGDPHLVTHDGHKYDFMAAGEFSLSADQDVAVQVRLAPAGQASVVAATAISFRGLIDVVLQCSDTGVPTVWLNREVLGEIAEGSQFRLPDGQGRIRRLVRTEGTWAASRYEIDFYQTGHRVRVNVFTSGLEWGTTYMTVVPHLPLNVRGPVTGLLGNNDGNPWNDLMFDGESFYEGADADHAELYGPFADHHRLVDAPKTADEAQLAVFATTSRFVYPAGKGTADFTDREWYKNPVTLDDFTEEDVAAASEACAGIRGEDFKANCVMDVLLTGDASFANAAAEGDHLATPVTLTFEESREAEAEAYAQAAEDEAEAATTAALSVAIYVGAALLVAAFVAAAAFVVYRRSTRRTSPSAGGEAGAVDLDDYIPREGSGSGMGVGKTASKVIKSVSATLRADPLGEYQAQI